MDQLNKNFGPCSARSWKNPGAPCDLEDFLCALGWARIKGTVTREAVYLLFVGLFKRLLSLKVFNPLFMIFKIKFEIVETFLFKAANIFHKTSSTTITIAKLFL
jgi:hypothetical protein